MFLCLSVIRWRAAIFAPSSLSNQIHLCFICSMCLLISTKPGSFSHKVISSQSGIILLCITTVWQRRSSNKLIAARSDSTLCPAVLNNNCILFSRATLSTPLANNAKNGSVSSGITTPMVMLFRVTKARALALGV